MNLGFVFDLRLRLGDAKINGLVNNLSDETYRDFLDTYEAYELNPGRNLRIRVTVPVGARWKRLCDS